MNPSPSPFMVFVRKLIYFTLILALLAYAIRYFLPLPWQTPALPYLILFFFSVHVVIHYVLLKTVKNRLARFVNYYLAGTLLKLFLYIIVLVLYVFLHRADALAFTLTFFVLYLGFTTFEVLSLLSGRQKGGIED